MISYNNVVNNNKFDNNLDDNINNHKNIIINSRLRNDFNINNIKININNNLEYINELELTNYNFNNTNNNNINDRNNTFEIYSSDFNSNNIDNNLLEDVFIYQKLLVNKINSGISLVTLKKKEIILENGNYDIYNLLSEMQNKIRNKTKKFETLEYVKNKNKIVFNAINQSFDTRQNIYTLDNTNLIYKNIFFNCLNIYINKNLNHYIKKKITYSKNLVFNERYILFIDILYEIFNKLLIDEEEDIPLLYNVSSISSSSNDFLFNKLLDNLLIYFLNKTNLEVENTNINNIFDIIDDNDVIINDNILRQNIDLLMLKNIIENINNDNNDEIINTIINNLINIINNYIINNNDNDIITYENISENTNINEIILLNLLKYIDSGNILYTNYNESQLLDFLLNINNKNNIKTYKNLDITVNVNMRLLYKKLICNSHTLTNYFDIYFNENSTYNFYIFNKTSTNIDNLTYYNEGYKISYLLGFMKDIIYYSIGDTYKFENNLTPNIIYNNKIYISINNYYNNYILNYIDDQYENDKNITFIIDTHNNYNNILTIKFPYDIHINKKITIIMYDQYGNLLDIYNDYELFIKAKFSKNFQLN